MARWRTRPLRTLSEKTTSESESHAQRSCTESRARRRSRRPPTRTSSRRTRGALLPRVPFEVARSTSTRAWHAMCVVGRLRCARHIARAPDGETRGECATAKNGAVRHCGGPHSRPRACSRRWAGHRTVDDAEALRLQLPAVKTQHGTPSALTVSCGWPTQKVKQRRLADGWWHQRRLADDAARTRDGHRVQRGSTLPSSCSPMSSS